MISERNRFALTCLAWGGLAALFSLVRHSAMFASDEIRLTLTQGDGPLSVPVRLTEDSGEPGDCETGGRLGRTSASGQFQWSRQIRDSSGRDKWISDRVVICAQIAEHWLRLWQREYQRGSELTQLNCLVSSSREANCVARGLVSLEEMAKAVTGLLFVLSFLAALLNRKSRRRISLVVLPMVGAVLGIFVLGMLPIPSMLKAVLIAGLGAGLLFGLIRLLGDFRSSAKESGDAHG